MEGRGLFANEPLFTLRLLREALQKSQTELAEASGLKQANISTLERKETLDGVEVATLRKYAAALGGQVQLVVVIGEHRYVLTG